VKAAGKVTLKYRNSKQYVLLFIYFFKKVYSLKLISPKEAYENPGLDINGLLAIKT